MVKVVVDCFGGDNSPSVNVEGAIKALNENKDLYLILTGFEELIKLELSKYEYDSSRIEILNAQYVISCHESPTIAIRSPKVSSMSLAFDLIRKNDDINAMVSIGSTGAILAGAVLKIGRINGVKRPAFCPVIPTIDGKLVGICDSGANMDCDSTNLVQFALMANEYMKCCYDIEKPRIALLNVGVEEGKGDMKRKETYEILKNNPNINFVGNMESRDLLSGNYDVVVCDGFDGNVLVKTSEGTAIEILKLLKDTLMKNLRNKIGALILEKDILELKDFFDYNNYGGGVMLGTKKIIVKGHGGCNSNHVYHCITQAYNLEKNKIVEKISKVIEETTNKE